VRECSCARISPSSSGRTATTISKRRNVQPIVGRPRRRPYADRHSMLRLSHVVDCCKISNWPLQPTWHARP
jgi:hypothetical protein